MVTGPIGQFYIQGYVSVAPWPRAKGPLDLALRPRDAHLFLLKINPWPLGHGPWALKAHGTWGPKGPLEWPRYIGP